VQLVQQVITVSVNPVENSSVCTTADSDFSHVEVISNDWPVENGATDSLVFRYLAVEIEVFPYVQLDGNLQHGVQSCEDLIEENIRRTLAPPGSDISEEAQFLIRQRGCDLSISAADRY